MHQTRDRWVHVRVTQDEYENIKKAAAAFGCTAGAYIRTACAAHALAPLGEGEPTLLGVSRREVGTMSAEMGAWGNNLNQVAHALNAAMAALRQIEGVPDPRHTSPYEYAMEEVKWGLDAMPELVETCYTLMGRVDDVLCSRVVEIPGPPKGVAARAAAGGGPAPCR